MNKLAVPVWEVMGIYYWSELSSAAIGYYYWAHVLVVLIVHSCMSFQFFILSLYAVMIITMNLTICLCVMLMGIGRCIYRCVPECLCRCRCCRCFSRWVNIGDWLNNNRGRMRRFRPDNTNAYNMTSRDVIDVLRNAMSSPERPLNEHDLEKLKNHTKPIDEDIMSLLEFQRDLRCPICMCEFKLGEDLVI